MGRKKQKPTATDDLLEYAADGRKDDLPDDIRELRKLVIKYREEARRNKAVHSVVLDALQEAFEPLKLSATIKPAPKPARKSPRPHSQHVLFSDPQCGKVTSTYNMEVFGRRMRTLFDKLLQLAEIQRSHHPVPDLIVHANGDLVEGERIFPRQQMEIEAGVLTQALVGAQLMAGEIARIAPHYERIYIPVTGGNHGRAGHDFDAETNWDLVWGHFLEHLLQSIPNITTEVEHNWYKVVRVNGWGFLQTHGDSIRSWLNIPIYGILQKMQRWLASIPEPWDFLLLGHFHTFADFYWNYSEALINGSFESDNEYARKNLGMAGLPMQLSFFSHPEIGITSRDPIWLEKPMPRRM